jgi:hypothetical protein
VFGDPVIADAIRDRLQHSALTINISPARATAASKHENLQQEKKDA